MAFDETTATWPPQQLLHELPLEHLLQQKAGRLAKALRDVLGSDPEHLAKPERTALARVHVFLELFEKGQVPHGPLLAFELQGAEAFSTLCQDAGRNIVWISPEIRRVEAGAEVVMALVESYLKDVGMLPEDPRFAPGSNAGVSGVRGVPLGFNPQGQGFKKLNENNLEDWGYPLKVPYAGVTLALNLTDLLETCQYQLKERNFLGTTGETMLKDLALVGGVPGVGGVGMTPPTYWISMEEMPEIWSVQKSNGHMKYALLKVTVRQNSQGKDLEASPDGWNHISQMGGSINSWRPVQGVVMDRNGRKGVWVAVKWSRMDGAERIMMQCEDLPENLQLQK